MKKTNKFFIIFLMALICLISLTAAFAADTKGPQVFAYHMNDEAFDALIYATSGERLSRTNFTLKIGKTEFKPDSLSPLSESDYGTSWIVVLESANNNPTLVRAVQTIVEQVAEGMGPKDNMAVYNTFGEHFDFTSDKNTISTLTQNTLRKISSNPSDKKLFDTIFDAISELDKNQTLNDHKSLLVISEFADLGSVHSYKDVADLADKFNGTIYAVGLTQMFKGKMQDFEGVKGIADNNASGVSYAMDNVDNVAGKNIGDQIRQNENSCYVLTTKNGSLSSVEETELPVVVSMQSGNAKIDSNSLFIEGAEFNSFLSSPEVIEPVVEGEPGEGGEGGERPALTPTAGSDATATPTTAPTEAPTETPVPTAAPIWPPTQEYLGLYIGIIAALIAIIAAIIIISNRKKAAEAEKKRREEERRKAEEARRIAEEERRRKDKDGLGQKPNMSGATVGVPQPVSSGKVEISLTKAKSGEVFKGVITDTSIKAGRDQKLRLTGDPGISSAHMEFIWQNGCMYVQDTKSTNGTYVNRNKITGATPLSQGDVIHAGSSDFTVSWRSLS